MTSAPGLAHLRDIKQILVLGVSLNGSDVRLGVEAALIPPLVASLLRTWPEIEKIRVISSLPYVANRMGSRVFGSLDSRFDLSKDFPRADQPDLIIDVSMRSTAALTFLTRPVRHSFLGLGDLIAKEQAISKSSFPESVVRVLMRLGLKVPSPRTALFQRTRKMPGVAFLSPQGRTMKSAVAPLRESWVKLGALLTQRGYSVVLNGGDKKIEKEYAEDIFDAMKGQVSDPALVSLKWFASPVNLIDFLAGGVEVFVTLDAGPFHLARQFGDGDAAIPTSVITGTTSEGWVPLVTAGRKFRRLTEDAFRADPAKVLAQLQELRKRPKTDPS